MRQKKQESKTKKSKHVFCHSRYLKQSHSCNQSNSSLHNLSLYNQNSRSLKTHVLVCTQNNPNLNTFDLPIHKRHRAKKMNNTPLQEISNVSNQPHQSTYPKSITITTQTDNPTNLGRGSNPLDPNRVENPFDIAQSYTPTPLTNLHEVLNVNFISEAIRLDNQSNRIRKMIQNQDLLALSFFSR